MTTTFTKRCNTKERAAFTSPANTPNDMKRTEPALGTLTERLDIICRRFDGDRLVKWGARRAARKPVSARTREYHKQKGTDAFQPALGSLGARLDIIIRRHGGSTKVAPLSPAERTDYAAWLTDNNLANVGDHWSAVPLPLEEVA